jgi:hypothetical protein
MKTNGAKYKMNEKKYKHTTDLLRDTADDAVDDGGIIKPGSNEPRVKVQDGVRAGGQKYGSLGPESPSRDKPETTMQEVTNPLEQHPIDLGHGAADNITSAAQKHFNELEKRIAEGTELSPSLMMQLTPQQQAELAQKQTNTQKKTPTPSPAT